MSYSTGIAIRHQNVIPIFFALPSLPPASGDTNKYTVFSLQSCVAIVASTGFGGIVSGFKTLLRPFERLVLTYLQFYLV